MYKQKNEIIIICIIYNNIMNHNYREFTHYWINNDTLIVKPKFNDNINLLEFHCDITSLIFSNYDDISDIIENINDTRYIGSSFNQPVDNLPPTLLNLTLGIKFNQPVDNLPPTLLNLTLGDDFDKPVDNLPPTLLNLTLGDDFNQLVDDLPPTLLNLTLGDDFNQLVDDLPPTLLNLTLGIKFNQPVDNLPHGILNIIFINGYFNQSLDNLPNSLLTINFENIQYFFNCKFDKQLNCLPNSICEIKLPLNYNCEIKNIPIRLKKIYCSPSCKFNNKFNNIDVVTPFDNGWK
jgi:hypothetical protein